MAPIRFPLIGWTMLDEPWLANVKRLVRGKVIEAKHPFSYEIDYATFHTKTVVRHIVG